jgi:type I restriction enzyme S subunit
VPNLVQSIRLGDVLAVVSRPEPVLPTNEYRLLGAHWYAKGLYVKEVLEGSAIQAKTLYRVEGGDFVYNRLFAWKGSFALAGESEDGCYVSGEFPCFRVDDARLDARYLRSYFRRSELWEQALGQSTGGTPTSRNRLKVQRFLSMAIPLPPLPEQRRIVARIEDLVAKIEEARRLAAAAQHDLSRVLLAAYREICEAAGRLPMQEVAPLVRRPVHVDLTATYREIGIRSFGGGVFHKPPVSGASFGGKRIYRIEPGDLLFNNVFAWEGAVATARDDTRGSVGSHRFITCVPRQGLATAEFLRFHFLTEEGLRNLGEASPGGAGRNRTLGLAALARIPVPVPKLQQQKWLDTLQAHAGSIAELRAQTAAHLDALLPSILDRAFKGQL